ncbi:Lrp/AsnC family transcriptional regulator [Oryzibacter oryziterrae]|uniref:Lrp/AsnC family transcriptional regulator n=1 Tax=Oryzibacter oryziterrae TaxID=2766474 RepID=UPI001F474591|nr:Lrp/AsnC family transcriptional regulator [Oryzibacter oryziterrae]
MDALDEKLVTLLRHNGRRSISDLAVDLGVSRATVRSRMERLESSGDILGYTVILRGDDIGAMPVRAMMMIEIEGHVIDKVIRQLGGFPEVATIHTTNGRWDLVVELGAPTLTDFDTVLRRIRFLPGITNSDTSILLTTPRTTRARL